MEHYNNKTENYLHVYHLEITVDVNAFLFWYIFNIIKNILDILLFGLRCYNNFLSTLGIFYNMILVATYLWY